MRKPKTDSSLFAFFIIGRASSARLQSFDARRHVANRSAEMPTHADSSSDTTFSLDQVLIIPEPAYELLSRIALKMTSIFGSAPVLNLDEMRSPSKKTSNAPVLSAFVLIKLPKT